MCFVGPNFLKVILNEGISGLYICVVPKYNVISS
jgi:hypothetical protein